jgi:hypothetical protein
MAGTKLPVHIRTAAKIINTMNVVTIPFRPWYKCASENNADDSVAAIALGGAKFTTILTNAMNTNPRYIYSSEIPAVQARAA